MVNDKEWWLYRKLDSFKNETCYLQNHTDSNKNDWVCYSAINNTEQPFIMLNAKEFNMPPQKELDQKITDKSPRLQLKKEKKLHFLLNDKIESVTFSAHAERNPDHLTKFVCNGGTKLSTCGDGCLNYSLNLNSELYTFSENYRINLHGDKLSAVLEFKLYSYDGSTLNAHDFKFNERKLKKELEAILNKESASVKSKAAFYTLSKVADKIATDLQLYPSEIRLMLY